MSGIEISSCRLGGQNGPMSAEETGDRPRRWVVWRQDDNGNRFEVNRYGSRAEADEVAATMEARGHKQIYWVAEA
jgi:hypothetical protein